MDETFTDSQVRSALESFLDYGEESYNADKTPESAGHGGYFSGGGWAARCLRWHLKQLSEISTDGRETTEAVGAQTAKEGSTTEAASPKANSKRTS